MERALQGLVRAALAAGVAELDGTALVRAAARLLTPARPLFVGLDHRFASIRLQGQAAGDAALAGLPLEPSALTPLRTRNATARVIEIETHGGTALGYEVVAVGRAPADADLARVSEALGFEAEPRRLAEAAISELDLGPCTALACRVSAGAAPVWLLRFVGPNGTAAETAATRAAILRVAPLFSVTDPQKTFVERVHARLAGGRPSAVGISLSASGFALGLEYVDPTWTTAVELFQGFWPAVEAGRRLGLLAGALGAQHPAMIRLELGPAEPPGVAVWARAA
jgi:hypothetical protein